MNTKLSRIFTFLLALSLLLVSVSCSGEEIGGPNRQEVEPEEEVEPEPDIEITPGSTPVGYNGHLSIEGSKILNQYGEHVQLVGVSYGWHNWWPRFYNAESVEHLAKDWKCAIVRAAMGVKLDHNDNNIYTSNPEYATSCVTTIVDAAIEQGMYVLIDWHSHFLVEDSAIEFFSAMAQKYGDTPNVIYEIFNEPPGYDYTWAEVKEYSINVINAIRQYDADNIIVVGSPFWSTDISNIIKSPITGQTNIAYTLHFYAATNNNASNIQNGQNGLDNDLAIFVTECGGMESSGDGDLDLESWGNWLEWMNENKVSWCAWSISDKDESCSMLAATGDVSSTGPWADDDLKEWGRLIRSTVQEINADYYATQKEE